MTYDPKAQTQAEDETPSSNHMQLPHLTPAPLSIVTPGGLGQDPLCQLPPLPSPSCSAKFLLLLYSFCGNHLWFGLFFSPLSLSGILGSRQKENEWGRRPGLKEVHTARCRAGMTSDLRALLERTLKGVCTVQGTCKLASHSCVSAHRTPFPHQGHVPKSPLPEVFTDIPSQLCHHATVLGVPACFSLS